MHTTKPSTYLLPRNGASEALWSREHFAALLAFEVDGGAARCSCGGGGPRLAELAVVLLRRG